MDEYDLEILQVVASPSRFRILNLLERGVDHPEDLARRLELRRQSVDKQLLELYGWGFVDRSAVFPADGRPRIVYRLSDLGQAYLEKASTISQEYREEMLADYRRSLGILEDDLASGDLDEGAYRKRRRSLETRYDHFLRGHED
ncbi:MAG: hypothetical protein R3291_02330 [Thermoplasmata archaeon]|nr:hypothetical protein [Thermoplasmata archaeon]